MIGKNRIIGREQAFPKSRMVLGFLASSKPGVADGIPLYQQTWDEKEKRSREKQDDSHHKQNVEKIR